MLVQKNSFTGLPLLNGPSPFLLIILFNFFSYKYVNNYISDLFLVIIVTTDVFKLSTILFSNFRHWISENISLFRNDCSITVSISFRNLFCWILTYIFVCWRWTMLKNCFTVSCWVLLAWRLLFSILILKVFIAFIWWNLCCKDHLDKLIEGQKSKIFLGHPNVYYQEIYFFIRQSPGHQHFCDSLLFENQF